MLGQTCRAELDDAHVFRYASPFSAREAKSERMKWRISQNTCKCCPADEFEMLHKTSNKMSCKRHTIDVSRSNAKLLLDDLNYNLFEYLFRVGLITGDLLYYSDGSKTTLEESKERNVNTKS